MKVICAWCGKVIGEKEGEGIDGISHGICEDCLNKLGVKAEDEDTQDD